MPEEDVKARLKKVGIALKDLFRPTKKKQITQEILNKEVEEFVKLNGYKAEDPDFDIDKFQDELIQYLRNKGYDFDGIDASVVSEGDVAPEDEEGDVLPKRITKISGSLNEYARELRVFVDTTRMMPGLVCYTIEKIAPTDKIPYVTYKPMPRVITQIHDSGVNGGTIFFTYNHRFTNNNAFENSHYVLSEEEVVYSPLTKEHADYICRLLNIQSKHFYITQMKKLAKQENAKKLLAQRQMFQNEK